VEQYKGAELTCGLFLRGVRTLPLALNPGNPPTKTRKPSKVHAHAGNRSAPSRRLAFSGKPRHATKPTGHRKVVTRRQMGNRLGWPGTVHAEKGSISHYAAPGKAPLLASRSMGGRATRMTCHAPVRTGGAVLAGWDLD